ncbi:unnamed protein product [Allacma fusca]|uniref:Bromodomain-containing protein 8 n=1 Tax=Allacma fusca TaxID=39272 RepID=A0A8J2LAN6_9HEXA|nr:unnamed protein product [Allacma fusca]
MLSQKIRAPRGRLPNAALAAGADTWTNREKICLIEAIQALGNDDWNEVSKFVHDLTKGNRTKEWCSPVSCSRQFQNIMETTGRQIRKKGDVELLPAIRQHYVDERLHELQVLAEDHRIKYMNLSKFNKDVEAGHYDNRVDEILAAYGNTEQVTEDSQDETPGLFYFAELSDLSEKISVINAFIQDEIGASANPAFPSSSGQDLAVPGGGAAVSSVPTITGEEDDDLSDLMDILPNMETFDADDIDATIMDTTEFEMMSPPDSTSVTRKGISTSPKVSPQLKNLVRTAIAGTSEEDRPRNVTPSAGAPTLSMLLEMPPRDPGQPLPEISSVSKAASSLLEQPKQDRMSPFRSAAATLEQLNIALAKSPTRHQDSPSKTKSSSPTLQRLLEGTISIKKEGDESKLVQSANAAAVAINLFPDDDVKIKQEEIDSSIGGSVNDNKTLSLISQPLGTPSSVPAKVSTVQGSSSVEIISEIIPVAELEIKLELDSGETPASKPRSALKEALPADKPISTNLADEVAEVKEEEVQPKTEVLSSAEESLEIQPLPPDVQDKVNNLKDLVIIQHTGVVTPGASPVKIDSAKVADNNETVTKVENATVQPLTPGKTTDETKTKLPLSETLEVKTLEEDEASMDISESGSVSMPVLTPVPALVPALRDTGKASRQTEPMEEGESYVTPPQEPEEDTNNKNSEELPELDFDDELQNRKKVLIPAKTYSRKERYGERGDLDDEDDSSNPAFTDSTPKNASPSRNSPARTAKSPVKSAPVLVPDKKGRKSRASESTKQTDTESAAEEETRVTRARSKPMSPLKAPPQKTSTRHAAAETEITTEPPVRVTRNRASLVHPPETAVSSTPGRKPIEDKDQAVVAHQESDHHVQGRTTRGRISSTTKVPDSLHLPGILPFESNPSSPCSSTTTSANLDEDKDQKAFRKSISFLWEQIKSHKHAGQFLKPITDTMVPHYNKKVYRPMDLTTVKRNIDSGIIRNVQSFERDVYLMLMNAIMYNSSDHEIHQRTVEMEQDVRAMLDTYKSTQKALRTAQMMENMGTENNSVLRSPVKLRSSARRQKISDSDADDLNPEDVHGFHTPMSTSDNEMEETEGNRPVEQKTRESSPDITSAVSSSSGIKRRSRTSSPTSGHLAMTSAAAGKLTERTLSTEGKSRQRSPDACYTLQRIPCLGFSVSWVVYITEILGIVSKVHGWVENQHIVFLDMSLRFFMLECFLPVQMNQQEGEQ